MNSVVCLMLLSLSVWAVEGKWCIGWQRKAGDPETPLLPCNFEEYDLDKNGSIEVAEFLRVAHGYGHEGTGVVFAIIDSNDDGIVMMEEFQQNSYRLVNLHLMKKC
ncbi:uncharacterized protein LOC111103488 [Crassostrea virginica]